MGRSSGYAANEGAVGPCARFNDQHPSTRASGRDKGWERRVGPYVGRHGDGGRQIERGVAPVHDEAGRGSGATGGFG